MAYDAGIKVGIEGNAEFKRSVRDINSELKTMDSALKLVESSYEGQMNSMDALKAKGQALQDIYDKQSEKVRTLSAALQNAQNVETQYADKANDLKEKLSAAQAEMERLKSSSGDTAAEQKRLANEVANLTTELKSAEQGQSKASTQVNKYQRDVNLATVQLNKFESELKDNSRYMSEAEKATDKCATSIDKYGKKTKEAAEATEEATEKSGLLEKIFAGGMFANLATQAINMVVGALKSLATAAFEAADGLMRLSAETGLSVAKLQEMQYVTLALDGSVETLQKAQAKLTRSMDDARRGSTEYADAFSRIGVEYRNADGTLRSATDVLYETFDALGKVGSEADRDAIALRLFGRSAMELNPLIKAGADELRRLSEEAHTVGAVMSDDVVEALDTAGDRLDMWWMALKSTIGTAIVGIGDFLAGNEKAAGKSIDTLDSLGSKVDELKSSYDSVYSSAKDSIGKQMGLWQEMNLAVDKSFSDIQYAIITQNQWLEQYSTNLANLSMRGIEGIDRLVARAVDGSADGASAVAALATASNEELIRLIGNMDEVDARKESLERQLAQMQEDTSRKLNEIYTGVGEKANLLDASDIAEEAARNTMRGYVGEVERWTGVAENAFRETARAANEAYKDELKIKSPSRVAMETTEDYFAGHIIKAKEMTSKMETAYSEPARKAQVAVQSVIPSVAEEPSRDFGAQASVIGDSISKALAGAAKTGGGRTINLTLNLTGEMDGRQVMKATRDYRIEEDELAGVNLIE